jgi:phosphatidylglycerol:prolipoprotein diacylglycerol transferase
MLALFLGLYGLFRFVVEFFREPDAQLGLLILHLSMGQLLCLLMLAVAVLLWYQRKTAPARTRSGQQRRSAPRR